MAHPKDPAVDFEIAPTLRRRWSPRAFSDRRLSPWTLRRILEAGRWAPSCFNEQPWSFMVALRSEPERFETMLGCINDKNAAWAKDAAALAIACASKTFTRNDKANRHAAYDTGAAVAMMLVEATQQGVGVHQMAGFDPEEAVRRYAIPDGAEPMAAIAFGYFGDPERLPADLADKERAPRSRKRQAEFVFAERHGEPWAPSTERPVKELLHAWFGQRDEDGWSDSETRKRWYTKDPAFDQALRSTWGELHGQALGGGCQDWLSSVDGRLAYVVLLDQIGRNIHRDTPLAFAGDAKALDAALDAIDAGLDHVMTGHHRCTLYMPLMHSERLEVQEQCVALFDELAASLPSAQKEHAQLHLKFAIQHRDIIRRFGRFPHRNVCLGRESMQTELEFLKTPGSSF